MHSSEVCIFIILASKCLKSELNLTYMMFYKAQFLSIIPFFRETENSEKSIQKNLMAAQNTEILQFRQQSALNSN